MCFVFLLLSAVMKKGKKDRGELMNVWIANSLRKLYITTEYHQSSC